MARTRPYNNTLREEHAQITRRRIVETAVDLIKEGSPESLSVPKLSERSRISVATIYRYFPNRESLVEGVHAWIDENLRTPQMPTSLEELPEVVHPAFQYYERSFDLFRAFSTVQSLVALNAEGKAARDAKFVAMIRESVPSLDPRRAAAIGAVLRILGSFDGYRQLRERFGIDPETAVEVVEWVYRTLLADLTGSPRATRKKKKTE